MEAGDSGAERIEVAHVGGGDPHGAPTGIVETFAPRDIGEPLVAIGAVVIALVLDSEALLVVGEVGCTQPGTIRAVLGHVDLGLGETGLDERESEPRLLG